MTNEEEQAKWAWAGVIYHVAYDEAALGVLVGSLLSRRARRPGLRELLHMAWTHAEENDEDSLRTDSIDAVSAEFGLDGEDE